MIKKATLFVENDTYLNNRIFKLDDPLLNRDNCLYSGYLLKKKLLELGVDLSTQDINPIQTSVFVIYFDYPRNHKFSNKESYLVIWESEVVIKRNWNKKLHKNFKKIFTWNDDLIDNKIVYP
jgi:hypothetical protein